MRLVFYRKVDKTTQKTTRELVLEYLQQNNTMTREELAEVIGVSANAIK